MQAVYQIMLSQQNQQTWKPGTHIVGHNTSIAVTLIGAQQINLIPINHLRHPATHAPPSCPINLKKLRVP